MLYKTHKKFGYLFGLIGLLVSFLTGFLISINNVSGIYNKIMVFLMTYIALRGAVFGAGFPDIDSPNSVPARHYPFLRKIFKIFNIKHRGKISHDVLSITIIFALTYLFFSFILKIALEHYLLTQILSFYVCYILARDALNVLVFKIVPRKQRKRLIRLLKPLGAIILYILFTVSGFISLNQGVSGLVQTNNFIAPLLKLWIIFGYIGSISHLFADMLTNEGIWFCGIKLAPAQVILVVRKIPIIGKYLISNEMKTGSSYEKMWSTIVSLLIIPFGLLVLFLFFGGNIEFLL